MQIIINHKNSPNVIIIIIERQIRQDIRTCTNATISNFEKFWNKFLFPLNTANSDLYFARFFFANNFCNKMQIKFSLPPLFPLQTNGSKKSGTNKNQFHFRFTVTKNVKFFSIELLFWSNVSDSHLLWEHWQFGDAGEAKGNA